MAAESLITGGGARSRSPSADNVAWKITEVNAYDVQLEFRHAVGYEDVASFERTQARIYAWVEYEWSECP
jgi:hypothetical protein